MRHLLSIALLVAPLAFADAEKPEFTGGIQAAVPLNVETNVVVYNCEEKVTKFDSQGNPGLMFSNGTIQILDYGNSFFALSTTASTVAFSDILPQKPDRNSYRSGQPVRGLTMGKGVGKAAGTYIYIGTTAMISWDCRK